MGHRFADITFTPAVKAVQREMGSRQGYESMEGPDDYNHKLGTVEIDFITKRDSFYMASVGESGWPYLQHRGGPRGFVKVLDEKSIGFSDFSGNWQYISVGNFRGDDRVALFFMDYPNRTRLKVLGRVQVISPQEQEVMTRLEDGHYRAQVERGFVISIEAFDWNCPQHITPRFTEAEIAESRLSFSGGLSKHAKAVSSLSKSEPVALGDGPLTLQVSAIRQLTPAIRAYELRGLEGEKLPLFKAGAHLRIPILLADGAQISRQYSISSSADDHSKYEIAVLKEESGRGGSRSIHDLFDLGTMINVDLPANQFSLQEDKKPVLLIAGGIGITPLKSMAHTLVAQGRDFELHYAAKSRRDMAYVEDLKQLIVDGLHIYLSDEGTRLDLASILSKAPKSAVIYVCGPGRLVDAVVTLAKTLGIPRDRIRFELFS